MNKPKHILSSLRNFARRLILTAWGWLRPRKVPCSRCGCDMRKAGVGLVERGTADFVQPSGFPSVGPEQEPAVPRARAYCPACAEVAADVDAKVKNLQALLAGGGLPYGFSRTQASDIAAAELIQAKRLGFAPKD